MTTADGDVIHMHGTGSAKSVAKDGSIGYRGSIHYHTDSEKYASLNGGVGVFSYDVGSDGVTRTTVWEWS